MATPNSIHPFHVSVTGLEGPAISITCALERDTNVLVIVAEEKPFREERKEGFALVTNVDLPAHDWRFTDNDARDAITSYFARSTQGTLDLLKDVKHLDPQAAIFRESYDENGPRYKIAPDISNGRLAILAACIYADRQRNVGACLSMTDDILELYGIRSY